MADEAPDEVRERIRADLRRAGLLPPDMPIPPRIPIERIRSPQHTMVAFLVGFIAPALVIIAFTLILQQVGSN